MDVIPLPRFKEKLPARNRRPSALDKVGTPFVLPADTVLYRQGESAESLYYLESGAVMVGVASAAGEPIIVAVHGPGAFFGARSLRSEAHKATASVLVQSTVIAVAFVPFVPAGPTMPQWRGVAPKAQRPVVASTT